MDDDGNFVTDVELTDYINQGISSLYDLMIDGDSESLFAINAPILTQVGTNSYALPADFYRLVSLDLFVGGYYRHGTPGNVRELARMAANPPLEEKFRYFIRWLPGLALKQLFIYPEVDEANLALVYVPEPPVLSADTDTFDGLNNWHEYIQVRAALIMVAKQEQDTTALEMRLRELAARIRDHIRDIDVGIPKQISDVAHIYEDHLDHHDHLPRP